MSIINPESAITAKVRTKYGNRLTARDYSAMVKSETVGDVVQYLKNYTYYRTYLAKVSNDIHRGSLENIIKEKQFESFLTICKYTSGNTPVTNYIFRCTEIHELMKLITLLSIKHQSEYIFTLPLYFINHTDIKLSALSHVHNHSELLSALEHTDYQKIISSFPPDANGKYNTAAIGAALDNYNYKKVYEDIKHLKSKKDKAELTAMFDMFADYSNYSRILRLKKYYKLNNADIRSYLIKYGALSGKKLDRLLTKDTYEETRATLIENTSVGKKAQKMDIMSEMSVQGKFDMCRQKLYFSTNPEIVLLAYYILAETELSNVIAVVEGVRYSMQPENITEILIM